MCSITFFPPFNLSLNFLKFHLKFRCTPALIHSKSGRHFRSSLVNRSGGAILLPSLCLSITKIIHSKYIPVETTRIIHHNQLLLTKFALKEFCRIQPMTSKVQSAADYWTIDRENLGTRLYYLKKSEMAASRFTSLSEEIFWMNNIPIIEFGFLRTWRILRISEGDIHRSRSTFSLIQ